MSGWLVALIVVLAVAVLVTLGFTIHLVRKLVRTYRALRSPETPAGEKAAFWASVVYAAWPVDLLPDPVLLDDIGFLLLAVRYLEKAAADRNHAGAAGKRGQEV
ncbi:YkvA family protein [Streptomyces specialis]|uniref:YkvA family protein n=1 Tax=Streptomyces specialis TaxID=498367 RepID=UPI00073E7165|nr:YkvA family protein [Streptomyces specialis]